MLADSPVAGELLCFQFTVRLNLQRLTRLIYFVADGVRKAHSEIWVRFFAVTHNTAESAGSRRQLGASLRAWTCGLACVSSGFRSPARAERPRRRFSPGPADLCSRQWVREALAEFEHELGAKLRPYLTLARPCRSRHCPPRPLPTSGRAVPSSSTHLPATKTRSLWFPGLGNRSCFHPPPRWGVWVTALEWPLPVDSRTALAAFLKTRS